MHNAIVKWRYYVRVKVFIDTSSEICTENIYNLTEF